MLFNKEQRKEATQNILSRLLQTFIQGLIILAPIGVTIWAVIFLFNTVDDILPNILHNIIPSFIGRDTEGNLKKIPGLGFLVVLVVVMLAGWISSSFVFGRIVSFFGSLL